MPVKLPRRYYLHKRLEAAAGEDWPVAGVWRWKQERQPGVALPADFPFLVRLVEKGYSTREDLDGADERELLKLGFSTREAAAILKALEALLET